jgi:cell division protein FtsW (lipid II flippase)
MAVTRSTAVERGHTGDARAGAGARPWPVSEFLWLAAASLLIASGLFLVFQAKSNAFGEMEQALTAKQLLNLNELSSREDLLPFLDVIVDSGERQFVAHHIYRAAGNLENVGAIARLRIPESEMRRARGLAGLHARLALVPENADRERSITLLTAEQFRLLKPRLIVRRPAAFRQAFLIWSVLFFCAYSLVQMWWLARGFQGDRVLLVPILLLTGAGLILMVSLRDPVRDSMIFAGFVQGVMGGCALLALLSLIDYRRALGKLSFVPLLGSFALSILLIAFGSGPGTSDAKVNLLGFQPVELIRILLILFLAGYFAERWDILRHARETRPKVAWLSRYIDLPPLEYTLPVIVCVGLSLLFFFLQKDLGPALVFTCLFLALYAVARSGTAMLFTGLAALLAGFGTGYLLGVPHTVSARVNMWMSPWNNTVHGGDQLAQSLWGFATGGGFGTGLGLGDPALVPAAHTDLILSALGEEWGFLGLAAIFVLYAVLLYRTFRIALRAANDYEFFLGTGLAAAMALQILLIGGGALGVMPLSGVVTPFLSYGRTSMLANFLVFAMVLSISRRAAEPERNAPFRAPVRAMGVVMAGLALVILVKAAYVQVLRSGPVMGQGALVVQADGIRRYQYNPRFLAIMREIPKGTIYDRNGIPLATSRWEELELHRADYARLGVNIDRTCSRSESRHYPFGGLTFDLLGDLRTRLRWGASNTSFIERDSATRLRGYDDRPTLVEVKNPKTGAAERIIRYDYRELVPLLRHRYEPDHPEVRRVQDRPRDVRMTIDARLEVRTAQILVQHLRQAGKDRGALVVLDSATGDLLASVSYPLPPVGPSDEVPAASDAGNSGPSLDRARYGLYPPGSTFKLVTAMSALRKDPTLAHTQYSCIRLPDGRVGNFMHRSTRPIRDDVLDKTPHGTLDLEHATVVSCNAYFAQLGTYDVGAKALFDTASLLGIAVAAPNTAAQLSKSLPQSSYGQGQVVASPFQMARVAATVANGGIMPSGRWILDDSDSRVTEPNAVLSPDTAATLARFMREVVTSGTGRRASGAVVPIAGKTGTAELADTPSHAWFIGFAPYGTSARHIAFSILIENGQYGGTYPAAAATEIVGAARDLGLIGAAGGRP